MVNFLYEVIELVVKISIVIVFLNCFSIGCMSSCGMIMERECSRSKLLLRGQTGS